MASTNKTPKLGLNQWAAGDPVLREDFNGDNLKIEAGMEALKARGSFKLGKYVGDGVANRIIDVGFRPKLVLLKGFQNLNMMSVGVITELDNFYFNIYGISVKPEGLSLTDNGFQLSEEKFFNSSGSSGNSRDVYYLAFY